MENAQQIFENHMRAVNALDPGLVAQDYAEDALFITPDNTYNGNKEIYSFYKGFLPNFKEFEFITVKQETNGNVVYFVWSGKNKEIDIKIAMDTYIIENGKIKQHTFLSITD